MVGGGGFVVVVVGDELAAEAHPREQPAGGAGVLTGDEVDGAEDGASAVGEVGEIADGRGDHVECAGLGGQRGVGGGDVGHSAGTKKSGAKPDFARGKVAESGNAVPGAGGLGMTNRSAAGRLAHTGDLAFPTGGTAPRNGRFLLRTGRTAAEDSPKGEEQEGENRFLERGHGERSKTAESPFCKTPRKVSG